MQLADLRHCIDDRNALVHALQDVVGSDRLFTHPADLIAYEYDGCNAMAALPDLVVSPVSAEEVVGVVKTAQRHHVPLIPRGSGTGLSGGAIAPIGGIIVSLAKMKRILHVDLASFQGIPHARLVRGTHGPAPAAVGRLRTVDLTGD